MGIKEFKRVISESKSYSFRGTKLIISPYFGGESVVLDLSKIDEEMLETLLVKEEEEEF